MVNEFEGFIKTEESPPIKEEKYPNEYKRLPSNKGYPKDIYNGGYDIYNKRFHAFLLIYFFITLVVIIIGGYSFLSYIDKGKLAPVVTQNVNPQIDTSVYNSYNDTAIINNQFYNNFTILIDKINILSNITNVT